ncbi:hypothetical protein [Niastella caeni]|nr:hypothetical protein [Niastella caeni]
MAGEGVDQSATRSGAGWEGNREKYNHVLNAVNICIIHAIAL